MWRASRRLIVECVNYIMRCGRVNLEIDDIPDYDIQEIPVYFQPQTFEEPVPTRQQDDLQHRPDAPCTRRRSSPEVLTKMLQAIDEMNETKTRTVLTTIHESVVVYEPKILVTGSSSDNFLDHS